MLPVVCLPGFGRSARVFEDLAAYLSAESRRFIACFDFRGHGRSEWDRNPAHYNSLNEMDDVLDGMAALGIGRAAVVGTGHGGIVAMLMSVARPNAVAGIVLNDIGPTLEPLGLARIKSIDAHMPTPRDWDEAASLLRRLHGSRFPALDGSEWVAWARTIFRDVDGSPARDHDPAIAHTLDGIAFDGPMPSLWNEFQALADLPCLAIRGENSDVLSQEVLSAMKIAHPGLRTLTVPGQGHPPQLRRPQLLEEIAGFIRMLEDAEKRPPRR